MPKQVALRLPADVYDEYAKRACREGRKVTPYLKQVLLEAAKVPPAKDCIIVQPTEEMRWALGGIARELGMTPAGVLLKAMDMMLNDLVGHAVEAREARLKAAEQVGSVPARQSGKSKPR
jgi:hypothetical protein